MQRYIMPLVWGFIVAAVVGFGLNRLEAAAGEPLGGMTFWTPMFLGALTAFVLANLAGNRKTTNATPYERDQALAFTPPAGATPIVIVPPEQYPRLRGAAALVAAPSFAVRGVA